MKLNEVQILSRIKKAKNKNDTFFYGNPCKYGHDGLRYVNRRSACVHCARKKAAENFIPKRKITYKEEKERREIAKRKGKNTYYGNPCKYGHDGLKFVFRRDCVECYRRWQKNSKYLKKESTKQKRQIYYKKYSEKNKDKIILKNKKYRKKNREEINKKSKIYKKKNKEIIKIKNLIYVKKNEEKIKESKKRYFQKNKKKINERVKRRYRSDINVQIKEKMRSRIQRALKDINLRKVDRTLEYVGCTIYQLKKHLENNFKKGMTWDNREEWEIDHIVPVHYFIKNYDLSNIKIQKICFNFNNLQPMWSLINKKKGHRIKKKFAEKKIKELKNLINAGTPLKQ